MVLNLEKYIEAARTAPLWVSGGTVLNIVGLLLESSGPKAHMGEICRLISPSGTIVPGEVVGFRDEKVLIMPFDDLDGIAPGSRVEATGKELEVPCGEGMLGRIVDALGYPMDHKPFWRVEARYSAVDRPPLPLDRERIDRPVSTGVRSIDGLITIGEGQRIGIFAGSGVGKSTLMGMIARYTSSDVNVIALVGERGREVKEFIERDLGEEGLRRSVVIVATSDEPALLRIKAAWVATAVAEYFRDRGLKVLLMMDSVTRWCMAMREVGLAVGEPPTTRGYTPSVFANLPRLLERAGKTKSGSITGIYTVLVEGDDMDEPIADAARGILDGHIVLSRELAHMGHYPAVDVLASVSRLMTEIASKEHKELALRMRTVLATYRRAEDLINIGAYARGSNEKIDEAIKYIERVNKFLCQRVEEKSTLQETVDKMRDVFAV